VELVEVDVLVLELVEVLVDVVLLEELVDELELEVELVELLVDEEVLEEVDVVVQVKEYPNLDIPNIFSTPPILSNEALTPKSTSVSD
jgi:hypothetical protein